MLWGVVGAAFVVIGLIGAVILVGLALPKGHTATSRVTVPAVREAVWKVLSDFENHAGWRPDVKKIERRADVEKKPAWVEHNSFGKLPMYLEARNEPSRMVTRIIDQGMPFGGSWTYELREIEGGTEVRITEDGVVHNPIFRFLSRFVMGYHGTMDGFLENLTRKFGGSAEPERVTK
jgi:hypothetical protein